MIELITFAEEEMIHCGGAMWAVPLVYAMLYTGGGQNLRTRREVLPVADDFLSLHTEVPFIDYFSH